MVKVDPLQVLKQAFSLNPSSTLSFFNDVGEECAEGLADCLYISIPTSASGDDRLIFDRSALTSFASKKGTGPHYTLDAVALLLSKRDDTYTEYLQVARRLGVMLIALGDKKDLLEAVLGTSDYTGKPFDLPEGHPDFSFLHAPAPSATELPLESIKEERKASGLKKSTKLFQPLFTLDDLCHINGKDFGHVLRLLTPILQSNKNASIQPAEGPLDSISLLKHQLIVLPAVSAAGADESLAPLITLYNAKQLLGGQNTYVPVVEAARQLPDKPTHLFLTSPLTGITYEFVDGPVARLRHALKKGSQEDTAAFWQKAIHGVVAQGAAWQFADWPVPHEPMTLFSKHRGIFFAWAEDGEEWRHRVEAGKWQVAVIRLSRTRRHEDGAAAMQFWRALA